ncbi:hypothetical protein SY2F82_76660 [Streptomyces sp. Y2F8-2]|uniref:NucA/NucB deoxyribonuclease domain-containing protein n=1 Tax=Streptomyces sp. Y2F8-2 TaxID=2759675 RepID=UPI001A6047C1|nr:NucA/NucB deoxyribonuclease domain-containing protein [Streptomyces sp. Y2F8-2]GHK05869.1 hypothetical protein SY2F82_76660 [Streptomyces sp. Y2F8-2]
MKTRTALARCARGAATAAALMLLTAATTAARPAPPTAQAHEPGAFIDASSVAASQLRGLDHPVPLADYARKQGSHLAAPRSATAPDDQQDLRQQCAAHATQANTATGWIKSRCGESCQKRPYDLVLRDKNGTTGRLWFDMWILGFAYDGSRRVDYVASIENIRVQAVPTEDATKWSVGQHFRHSIERLQQRPRSPGDRAADHRDEYPFASTKEGSTKGDNRFSVRLIDGKDNRKGGERLNHVYTLNRILDGDPFYVKITD